MGLAAVPIIPRDGILTIKDGAGSPLSYAIPYTDGDFSMSGLVEDQSAVQSFKNRGAHLLYQEDRGSRP